ncbi:MAG: hypothetical protein IT382_09645, partial [Deltaproteobacteria bacterium]|nr:hypothetical protein [Deltaproteobacteria bacterium]
MRASRRQIRRSVHAFISRNAMSEPYVFQMRDLRKVHPGGKEVLKG